MLLACLHFFACSQPADETGKKKGGICIHAVVATPKASNCGPCTGGSPTCDIKYYTYCSNENRAEDCTEYDASCNATMDFKADYNDTIAYYDDKSCETEGYTITCPNPRYKAAAPEHCPPY
ncbi:MAG: hypothetical protein NZL89_01600 [Leptospiraceae bacterium]|nr:hypothetical protein [Leptospiraceae bacterium]